jgi:heptaprenyl diphosphate synthase
MTAAPWGINVGDPALEADLNAGMAAVEELLRASVKSDYPFVTETSRHLVDAGGKRFRPLLVLLAAQFGDAQALGVVPAAVVVELTHLATLYHDDVMDEAALRRGAPSANARWDNTVAILTGDFLFARASDLLADLGPEAVRIQSRTFERLVTGQIRETVGAGDGRDPLEHYLSVVADKTGSLIATSGRFGAMLSGADETVIDVMTRYGERIGVAFQLSDDILDVASESVESGKTPGTDLREGVPTLPVFHALRSDDPADARLLELLSGPIDDDADHLEALRLLRAHPAMAAARADLKRWAEDARAVLEPLPDVSAKAALAAVCDAVIARTF